MAEEILEQREWSLRSVLDILPYIAYLATPAGEKTYLNKRWAEYTGISRQEGLGMKWKDILFPDDYDRFVHIWRMNVGKGMPFSFQYRLKNARGEYRWHVAHAAPMKDDHGNNTVWVSIATDIQGQKLVEEELREYRHFLAEVTKTTPDLICVYDTGLKKFTYVNSRIYLYLGYTSEELLSFSEQDILQRIHPSDQSTYLNFHKNFVNATDEDIREIEYRAKDKQGEWKWLRSRGKVFQRDENGKVSEFIAFTQEVTAKKEVEEKERQNQLLQALLVKKDEFMSIASHELKTPITTMKASLQIINRLVEKNEGEKVLQVYIKKANQQVNKLVGLLTQLMDNTSIQAGKLALNFSSFYMQDIIDDCIAHSTNSHKIIVSNKVKESIEGDKIRIEQVLMNFLSNAMKYSPREKEIFIHVLPEEQFVKVSVTDFGIGIPADKVSMIFNRFYRVDERSVEFSGLGLGLYISAEIIERHGGEYGVESEEGKGSTFWFKIPCKHHEKQVAGSK